MQAHRLHVEVDGLACCVDVDMSAHLQSEGNMSELPPCPKCASTFTYEDRELFVCPECAHKWTASATTSDAEGEAEGFVVRDANGVELKNGDAVVLIKDLKVKGATSALKAGTKVKNIRLVDSDHNIDCKIDGFGAMALKSEFVKRA